MKLTVLVEDSVAKPNLAAKHGLSFLIETASAACKSRILMDAGPPPDVAVHNAHEMKEDIRRTPQVWYQRITNDSNPSVLMHNKRFLGIQRAKSSGDLCA